MKKLGSAGLMLMLFLIACSTTSSKQEAELVESGFTAMSGGDYDTAEHLLNQALVLNDKNPYALLNLGVINQEVHRYDKAREYYQAVIDLDSSKTAVSSNIQGYAGKKLTDIARINMGNLPLQSEGETRDGKSEDLDGDGVPNDLDQCDGTPKNTEVTANGCWALVGLFATGKTDIEPEAHAQLDRVVMVLQDNPSLRIEIQGHTDNRGSTSVNQFLSEERAKSVMLYLLQKGIESDRLEWVGYGSTWPVASNDTADGQEQNRRVELNPIP
jgi:outer membrane protein OmpA-like peptidoglycan-associated protein